MGVGGLGFGVRGLRFRVWGLGFKLYHIQCDTLRPAVISPSACSNVGQGALGLKNLPDWHVNMRSITGEAVGAVAGAAATVPIAERDVRKRQCVRARTRRKNAPAAARVEERAADMKKGGCGREARSCGRLWAAKGGG